MQRLRKIVKNEECINLHKVVEGNSFNETDILRRAYELILENSSFFYSELADAFNKAVQIQNKNSTEMFVE
jgi:hypothetical protein